MDKITGEHPKQDASMVKTLPSLQGLTPADPLFHKPGRIDVLLGADVLPYVHTTSGPQDSIIAVDTVFGHAFMGTYPSTTTTQPFKASIQVATEQPPSPADVKLCSTIARFWEVEESLLPRPTLTAEELRVQAEYAATHSFVSTVGKYKITLPRKQEIIPLSDSKPRALQRFYQNERAVLRKGTWQQFQGVIQEYLDLNHSRPCTKEELQLPSTVSYYMPMHGVVKASSSTTKLRVVFDGSALTTSGYSLNDTLAVGPMLHPTLDKMLLKFRLYRVALAGDISRMYREILLSPPDQQLHRFLWRAKVEDPVTDYCMCRVTFGVASSPYVAVRTLQQAAADLGVAYPNAQYHITQSFYVDDLLGGADTVQEAITLRSQISEVLSKGGFTLRKFRSNSKEVLNSIPTDLVEPMPSKELVDCHSTNYPKALGVVWDSVKDIMSTDVCTHSKFAPTKRGILSDVSRTFDVLGWIAPAIIPMKILFQQLWQLRVGWDDELPEALIHSHQTWRDELPLLADLQLPRSYFLPEEALTVTLHGFSDASERAYAGVIYIRATYKDSKPTCRLVVAKSRVAPLKQRTIPELGLCGAVLLASLLETTSTTLSIPSDKVTAWCDSTIVLCWLRNTPSRYKTFIANRITTATTYFPPSIWFHVPTDSNPADCASRGLSAGELRDHALWWKGPPWLRKEPVTMPRQPQNATIEALQDEEAKPSTCLIVSSAPAVWLANRHSSYRTVTHITAWVKRAAYNFMSPINLHPLNKDENLTVEEVRQAVNFLLKCSQRRTFHAEIALLTASPPQPIKSSSNILQLNPFMGPDGLLHVGGRLTKAPLSWFQKHPVMLSSKDPLTILIFNHKHVNLCHCGPTLLFSHVGSEYFVSGAKRLARTVCKRCITCQKVAAKADYQLMGQLPRARLQAEPPFTTTGVDYAGPFLLKTSNTRRSSLMKGFLAVFVCFATKSVHLEVVSGLTTEAFLAALKRFVSRRGLPRDIYSDNGGNFRGASKDLKELYQLLDTTEWTATLRAFFLNSLITWHTIPERAPHFGGLWEAAVKAAKHHLKRVVGEQKLTFEEFATITTQVEACLNSRPLLDQHSHSPDGIQPLTPGHALIGKPIVAYPETEVAGRRADRWTMCQGIVQQFWRRWSTEYFHQLQVAHKWKTQRPNYQVGDVVLMKDASAFQTH